VEVVRRIFRMYADDGLGTNRIARQLNNEGIPGRRGGPWNYGTISYMLRNEKYVGHNVFNHLSYRLSKERRANPPELWIRADNAFDAIIDPEIFERAQIVFRNHTDKRLLASLREHVRKRGRLYVSALDYDKSLPLADMVQRRFGSLRHAYNLIGYTPPNCYDDIPTFSRSRVCAGDTVDTVCRWMMELGGEGEGDRRDRLIRISPDCLMFVAVVSYRPRRRSSSWFLTIRSTLQANLILVVRLNRENNAPMDYFLIPRDAYPKRWLRFRTEDGAPFSAYRSDDLKALVSPLLEQAQNQPKAI
jgi:hypothetical protein